MSVHDQIKAWSQGDDDKELSLEKSEGSGEGIEEVPKVNFTDPSNIAKSAQEMMKTLKEIRPDIEPLEQPETGMSPEEIKAAREEREAILGEMAAKVANIHQGAINRETREITEEAQEIWDDALK